MLKKIPCAGYDAGNVSHRGFSVLSALFSRIVLLVTLISLFGISTDVYAGEPSSATDEYVSAQSIVDNAGRINLRLRSHAALVYDERDAQIIMQRNSHEVMPIASLTKLVTAMVVIDAGLSADDLITIHREDKDRLRYSHSRLKLGMQFRRVDLLLLALAASENRAARALARTYPGGMSAFMQAMNNKARQLGLKQTHFEDPAGLSNDNVSTAAELLEIVRAASHYPLIQEYTTQKHNFVLEQRRGRRLEFGNTNRLISRKSWPIRLSKTGYTSTAGNCLVMQTSINQRPVVIVLLESWGKLSKYGDSNRIRKWLVKTENLALR